MNSSLANKLKIDGIDAYTAYGLYMAKDGYNELLAFPPMKKVTCNDWDEEDGIDIDPASMMLNSFEAQVTLNYGDMFDFGVFTAALSNASSHVWNFVSIGRSYTLRTVSMPKYTCASGIGQLSVRLALDTPSYGVNWSPVTMLPDSEEYLFDSVMLSKYNVRVLEGSLAEIKKLPAVKTKMVRNVDSASGAIADTAAVVTYKHKDVNLNLLMTANTLRNLWRNYDALLYRLTRQQVHKLYCGLTGVEYDCYYSKCRVSQFCPTNKIWLQFTLTLVFVNYRPPQEIILVTEDNTPITTQNDYYIDIYNL